MSNVAEKIRKRMEGCEERNKEIKEGVLFFPSLRKREGSSSSFVPPCSYLCSRPNPNRINCEQTVLYERRMEGGKEGTAQSASVKKGDKILTRFHYHSIFS